MAQRGGEQAHPEAYGALLARVSALEAELKEVKDTLAGVLALISGDGTAQVRVTRLGDIVTGPCLLLELPVEVLLVAVCGCPFGSLAIHSSCRKSCIIWMAQRSTMLRKRAWPCTTSQVIPVTAAQRSEDAHLNRNDTLRQDAI